MVLYTIIAASCISFMSAFCIIPFLRALAFKAGVLDIPNGALKQHESPTPYLGGVAVFFGCALSLFFFSPANSFPPFFFIGLLFLLLLGLIDDLYAISPAKKFLGQSLACFCFIKAGLSFNKEIFIDFLPSFLHSQRIIGVLSTFFSSWWMLSVINAFNLVDVMDGLTTTIALVASLSFIAIALVNAHYLLVLWLSCLCGALLAFFWYNKPRASMYLGDAGSLFIGGCLATVPFFLKWGSSSRGIVLIPLLVLMIPLVELCSLMIIRSYKGIPVYHGSPHHFICYLKARRWSVGKIIALVGFVGGCFGVSAFFIASDNVALLPSAFLLVFLVIIWVFTIFYGYKKTSFF